jgi:antitoxin VapB
MTLTVIDPETDRLAREMAALTGESSAEAVRHALNDWLARERLRRGQTAGVAAALVALGSEFVPDGDTRTPDQIIGYGGDGLPA